MKTDTQTLHETEQAPLQLLTFLLDKEVFAIEIDQIQEVLEYTRVTPVPRTPSFMLGVINLRGSVVSVIDMRQQFEMSVTETTVDSCIIITEIDIDGERCALGLLADAVKEVVELDLDSVKPPPRIGSRIDTRYIMGMGKYDDDFVIILDIPKVFSQGELNELANTVPDSASIENNDEQPELGQPNGGV